MSANKLIVSAGNAADRGLILFYLDYIVDRCKKYLNGTKYTDAAMVIKMSKDLAAWCLTSKAARYFDVTHDKFMEYNQCVLVKGVSVPKNTAMTAARLYRACYEYVASRIEDMHPSVWYVNIDSGTFFPNDKTEKELLDRGENIDVLKHPIAPLFALHPYYNDVIKSLIGDYHHREECTSEENIVKFVQTVIQEIKLKTSFGTDY